MYICITIIHPASFPSCDETVMQAYNLMDCRPGICGTPTPTSEVINKKNFKEFRMIDSPH